MHCLLPAYLPFVSPWHFGHQTPSTEMFKWRRLWILSLAQARTHTQAAAAAARAIACTKRQFSSFSAIPKAKSIVSIRLIFKWPIKILKTNCAQQLFVSRRQKKNNKKKFAKCIDVRKSQVRNLIHPSPLYTEINLCKYVRKCATHSQSKYLCPVFVHCSVWKCKCTDGEIEWERIECQTRDWQIITDTLWTIIVCEYSTCISTFRTITHPDEMEWMKSIGLSNYKINNDNNFHSIIAREFTVNVK